MKSGIMRKTERDNQDGLEYNCTWNCGAEGPTRKQNVRQLRFRQLKNAFAVLLLSREPL